MKRLRWTRLFASSASIAVLLFSFQNCSSGNGQAVEFRGSTVHEASGNGQPYEGKPDPGNYYNLVPGFTCGGGQSSIAGEIHVTTDKINSITVDPQDCSKSQTTLRFEDVKTVAYDKATLGFKRGIYQRYETAPNPVTADKVETWCSGANKDQTGFDVTVKQSPSGTLSAEIKTSGGGAQSFSPARQTSVKNIKYQNGTFSLTIDLISQAADPDQLQGQLSATVGGQTLQGAVSCRTTLRPPPADGVFVLSKSTTRGNMGGLAGANIFCLNELANNDFKGKSGVAVDASHVFAFLCDSTKCNNLPGGKTFTFAAAGNPAVGGASFTTDVTGTGPGSMFNWDTPETFGGAYITWTNRDGDSAGGEYWYNKPGSSSCSDWTTSSNSPVGQVGRTDTWNGARWDNGGNICSDQNRLICVAVKN